MKKYFTILFVLAFGFANAQTSKKIIITKSPKTVPQGKVWKLESNQEIIIQLNEGVLKSGTLCNAMFLSRPGIVFNINKGSFYEAEGFGIIFKEFEKVQYTNDVTYSIIPISFVDKNFDLDELSSESPENVGTKEVIFKAGESVFVGSCLMTIEMTEYNMSKADLAIENKKREAVEAEKARLKSNFNIPINPEKYVEPGTIPTLKDSLLTKIIFSSNGVMHKRPGKGFAFDDVSTWKMTLTIEDFVLKSSNGINKSYKLLDIKYDETMRMQEFQLGDYNGNHTHNLSISWSNSSNQYSVLLNSIDFSEEYQFQETQATSKQ